MSKTKTAVTLIASSTVCLLMSVSAAHGQIQVPAHLDNSVPETIESTRQQQIEQIDLEISVLQEVKRKVNSTLYPAPQKVKNNKRRKRKPRPGQSLSPLEHFKKEAEYNLAKETARIAGYRAGREQLIQFLSLVHIEDHNERWNALGQVKLNVENQLAELKKNRQLLMRYAKPNYFYKSNELEKHLDYSQRTYFGESLKPVPSLVKIHNRTPNTSRQTALINSLERLIEKEDSHIYAAEKMIELNQMRLKILEQEGSPPTSKPEDYDVRIQELKQQRLQLSQQT